MPTAASVVRAEQDAVRMCHSGLHHDSVRREVLRAVRRIMPVDAAFFATADPETLLFTGAWTEEPLAGATPLFLANEFGGEDVNKFAALASRGAHVASLDQATRRDRPTSPRYRDIMRPLGLGDELRAALVADGQCWGYLCLHREDRQSGFLAAEAATLGRLAPHIARALRNATLLHTSPTVAEHVLRPGVVLLAEDLSLIAVTPEAEHLLSLIEPDDVSGMPLPMAIYAVAATLRAVEHGASARGARPSARVPTRSGSWLSVHAARLTGPSDPQQMVVILEPVEPRAAVPLILSAYGLTPREAEVARLVLRGYATLAIVDALHISRHTVQDHLKSVFDKTGFRSRRDLIGGLLNPSGT